MKHQFLLAGLLLAASASFAWISSSNSRISRFHSETSLKNTSGAPAGRTGAPGEGNCTACHSGTVQSGNGITTFQLFDGASPATSYLPDSTYTATLDMGSAGAKNGFELVALSPANAQAGTFTALSANGVKEINGSAGKKYITHNSAGTAQSSWTFEWTAPSSNVGDVTFYVATNQTNSNNSSGGDIIRLSQYMFGSDASLAEKQTPVSLSAGYNPQLHSLRLNISSLAEGKAFVNITDLSGKSLFTEELGNLSDGESTKEILLPSVLHAGIYLVNFSVDNAFASQKIYIY